MDAKKLPAPRIQLRWAKNDGPKKHEYRWLCHYELVLPLDKYDIRADIYGKGDIPLKKKRKELVVAMKEPSLRGSSNTPCTAMDGTRYFDAPFRDGAHAHWDAKLIGNPPIYVIAPDGMAFKRNDEEWNK